MKVYNRQAVLVMVTALAVTLSTSVFASPPKPAKTKFLKTTGAGFSIDRKASALYYAMSFEIRKKLKTPLYVLIQYQNPENADTPFIQNAVLEPNQKVFQVESPMFKRIKNNHSYEVLVKLYSDEQRKNLISTHSQQVYFSVPEKLAPKLGVDLIK